LNLMRLYCREYGTYNSNRSSLILLHGLLGSSANWHGIARRLAALRHVLVPDLRNHGRSPHAPEAGYPDLATDLLDLLDEHGLDEATFIGHSMGGKAAMWLALTHGERVERLIVADIAPVAYPNRFSTIYHALNAVDTGMLAGRRAADEVLARYLPDPGLRQYLLQNLELDAGRWRWRVNLPALQAGMEQIVGFPPLPAGCQYPGPVQFLHGGESDYILPAHGDVIRAHFPLARIRSIPGAGHWLYAEKPEQFFAALSAFLAL
jgi:esterase